MELNEGQRLAYDDVFEFIYKSDKKVHAISGKAGTGKTHLIHYIAEQIPSIVLTATTNEAARLIGGITIHRYIGFGIHCKKEFQGQWNSVHTILIDEASMLQRCVMEHLIKLGNKIILVGDANQLTVGDTIDLLAYPHSLLTQNMRAKSEALKNMVSYLTQCVETQTIPNFSEFKGEHLYSTDNYKLFLELISKCDDSKIVLAYRNKIVDNYNELVGNAFTVHKSQGKTYHTVFIDYSDIMDSYTKKKTKYNNPISLDDFLRLTLVGFSRAQARVVVFYGKSRSLK